jgi:hypothetical protein
MHLGEEHGFRFHQELSGITRVCLKYDLFAILWT